MKTATIDQLLTRACYDDNVLHAFACDAAEHVRPDDADPRSIAAIETKRRWLQGEATNEELALARLCATSAIWDLFSVATWAPTWAAVGATCRDASDAVANIRAAASPSTRGGTVAEIAARDTERAWQAQHLIEMLSTGA